ncbi:MAG: hypothetical protein M3315_03295 [Actinomycetota bacterium]|jgi:hypothetical protein|nr:hypothetical protein [Actinomycetota bacterium]HZB82353.1 hypothetical protein [Rubrobacteraceae bacterium]
MAEFMSEQEFEDVLYKILTLEQVPGIPEEHHIKGVIRSDPMAGVATGGPGLVVKLNNGAEFEISIRKRLTG